MMQEKVKTVEQLKESKGDECERDMLYQTVTIKFKCDILQVRWIATLIK
jgi:hypothetical protein